MVAKEAQCGHKADARRGDLGRVRRGHSERPQQVMGDEQAIDLLEDADWALAAKGTRRSLMGLELVHHQLDFPALVVSKNELARRCGSRVQQGGDQAVLDPVTWTPWIVKRVA